MARVNRACGEPAGAGDRSGRERDSEQTTLDRGFLFTQHRRQVSIEARNSATGRVAREGNQPGEQGRCREEPGPGAGARTQLAGQRVVFADGRAGWFPSDSVTPAAPVARAEEHVAAEPTRAPEPPQRTFEELVVSADSVLGLQTENRISSETARVEDRVEARVTRDVKVGDRVAIPAGSRAIGSVMLVERGGRFKERARLGIQFHTLVLADGTRLPMKTETVYRDGEAPGSSSAAKVGGGAIGGAILGAILGGGKGAAIGATAGAGGGAAMVQNGDRSTATLPAGTPMTVRVLSPVTVTIER